jgi:ABC-type polysaccharide/polyol phosphate export permease
VAANMTDPMRTAGVPELRLMAARRSVLSQVRELTRFRDLVGLLVRKELIVRYQHSVLGFVWSMIQPLFLLVVYTLVFAILGAGFANFAIWVLCGLLVWTMLSTSLVAATQSITSNASLVGKVKFPRAVLPLASVGAALVHLCLQTLAFGIILAATRHSVAWSYMWLLPIALVTCVVVCAALSVLLAPMNVYARDTMHLLDLIVLGWFWVTPILYQYERASSWFANHGLPDWVLLLNPATPVVITVQRAIYGSAHADDVALLPANGPAWYLAVLALTLLFWLTILTIALKVFDRADVHMAETL